MKKASLFILAVLLISSGGLMAQGFHIGVKAGTNLNNIDGRSFNNDFKWGFSAGGFAELNFNSHIGLQPEVLFNQTRTQTASDFNQVYEQGLNSTNVELNYLTIPVLLSIRPIKLLSILVGPQYGILINSSRTILYNGKEAFKFGEFSVVGGAQLNLGGFKAGARYVVGLNNLDDVGDQDKWKSQQVQFYIGFRII